ncbi:MAG: DUF3244 domain-containing protein [Bacteroidales bacterium]|nr:DUF3244 domain-containing protein [Bacteroidales bacterium]
MNKLIEKIKDLDYKEYLTYGLLLKVMSFIIFTSFFSGCKSFDKINIGEIQEVKVNGIAGQTVYLEFKVPIENVSKLNIKITDVDMRVEINDTYIGQVSNIEKIKISKKSNEVYDIKLKLKIAGLFGAFNALKVLNDDKGNLYLNGDIKAKLMGINKTIEIDEKQEVDFSGYKNNLF